MKIARLAAVALALGCSTLATSLFADEALPPWGDKVDIPLPSGVRSVTPTRPESAIFAEPGRLDLRRGSTPLGARLPLFASRRANGCQGRWFNVGPLAWICSDQVELSFDDPLAPALGTQPWVEPVRRWGAALDLPPIDPLTPTDDGLPYRYFFAGADGAFGFQNLETALDDSPDQELEPGFAVAILQEASAHGGRWGKTKKGRWVSMKELGRARANLFHGALLSNDAVDIAWVNSDKADVFGSEKAEKPTGMRVRFELVRIYEEKPVKAGSVVRVSAEGETPVWMRSKDLARPRLSAPPPEVPPEDESARWIDVDLASQTLVAYVGKRPVFSTIVSTGKGPPGSETATHPGTFRIWVKLFTTKMDNLDDEEAERHYAIEDVPWVQFFDKAIGFHAAFWHRDFGRTHSHGCVNLAPIDARWLFAFTSPHLPLGWTAVLPTKIEQGAVVRVK